MSHSGNRSRLEPLLKEVGAELEVWRCCGGPKCEMTAVASTHLMVVGSGEMWEDSQGNVFVLVWKRRCGRGYERY